MSEQTGYVYFRSGLSEAERDAALDGLEGLTAVIHYSATQMRFESWRPAELAANGRAFGPAGEARWEMDGDGRYSLLVSGETPRPELRGPGWQSGEMSVDPAETIYLWGDHWRSLVGANEAAPDGWVQAQIEADLRYPVQGGGRNQPLVQVEAQNYRQEGVIRFTRFVKLKTHRPREANHG
jgi:hypothetical protein